MDWVARTDRGEPFADAVADLVAEHPQHAAAIAAFHERWVDTLGDAVDGTVALLRELRGADIPVYGLTNFSAETWPLALERFAFLNEFSGAVISGQEGVAKPDPAIYERLTERFGLDPARLLFADDREDNVAAARAAGWQAVVFTTPVALREILVAEGLLGTDA